MPEIDNGPSNYPNHLKDEFESEPISALDEKILALMNLVKANSVTDPEEEYSEEEMPENSYVIDNPQLNDIPQLEFTVVYDSTSEFLNTVVIDRDNNLATLHLAEGMSLTHVNVPMMSDWAYRIGMDKFSVNDVASFNYDPSIQKTCHHFTPSMLTAEANNAIQSDRFKFANLSKSLSVCSCEDVIKSSGNIAPACSYDTNQSACSYYVAEQPVVISVYSESLTIDEQTSFNEVFVKRTRRGFGTPVYVVSHEMDNEVFSEITIDGNESDLDSKIAKAIRRLPEAEYQELLVSEEIPLSEQYINYVVQV